MNSRNHRIVGAIAILTAILFGPSADATLNVVTNVSGNPNIFECSLTATQLDVTIDGKTVHAMAYKDENTPSWPLGPGIPVLLMNLKVGQEVICHFKNTLPTGKVPEGASIHWHGIELDNDSDGTGVTQDTVKQGQSYTYQFKVTRPGVFWFHSHMTPGNTTFAGMYGAIIIPNPGETSLISSTNLPAEAFTYTLAMSDIEFNPTNGFVGKFLSSSNDWLTLNDLVNLCHQTANSTFCGLAGTPGSTVLVNGENPNDTAQTPLFDNIPGKKRIRLRLLNEATARHFRLKLMDANSAQIPMYRIGGQGGLLNTVLLEGGNNRKGIPADAGWDTKYDEGEIVVGSGDRVDVIAYVPESATNTTLQLVGNPLPSPFLISGPGGMIASLPTNYPIAFFKINGSVASDTAPNVGDRVLPPNQPITNLKTNSINSLLNPAPCGGSNNPVIRLTNTTTDSGKKVPAIDGVEGTLEGNLGNGDFLKVPRSVTARYAKVGDLIELRVRNETGAAHPFHLHGFSMQPVRVLANATGNTNYTYNYEEFVDTIDVYNAQTLVFRVRLEDREQTCDLSPSFPPGPVLKACTDSASGGALGRWVFHCHIFSHAGVGMIGELIVVGDTQQSQWVQHPDLTPQGLDLLTSVNTGSKTISDDFMLGGGPVTGIRIWGSWLNDIVDPNTTFELKFWTDVPPSPGRPSRPGWQAWQKMFPPGSYITNTPILSSEGFYNPSVSNLIGGDTLVFPYDFAIPDCDAFMPRRGTIYWLSVTAYATNGLFGWKSSVIGDRWGDDATWSPNLIGPHWSDLHYPPGHPDQGLSLDTSFELFSPAATAPPPPPPAAPAPWSSPLLSVSMSDGNLTISWDGEGVLQSAPEITGPWSDIDGATSPYLSPMDELRRFFRVRSP